jgi:flagellar biosynthetic protein FlhB
MADERTEAPTPRRRSEARKKGQVAKSIEINSAAIILAAFWLLNITGPRFYDGLSSLMQRSFTEIASIDTITFNTLRTGGLAAGGMMVKIVAPLVLTLMLVGVVANVLQVGFMFSTKALQPDLNKINPLNGVKRLFSGRGFADFVKSLLKLLAVGIVVYLTLRDNYSAIAATSRMALPAGLGMLSQLGIKVGLRVAVIMIVIAVIDLFYQRWEFEKSLRMTRHEIKEEQKNIENPELKRRIRTRQRELAMRRMMAAIPEADVVITNPTHLAVALRYQQGRMQAPKVVAKGQRLVAERIKEKARQHQVPLVENKPLAQSLFKMVEIGQSIPVELYQAVAEVLAFVYHLKSAGKTTIHSMNVGR